MVAISILTAIIVIFEALNYTIDDLENIFILSLECICVKYKITINIFVNEMINIILLLFFLFQYYTKYKDICYNNL